MVRFAHFSDVHLGSFRDEALRELNLQAFLKAIDECVALKVDFVIISGDLFDVSIPDLRIVDSAVRKIRFAREQGIAFYVVYGSHDYSPTESSIIGVLEGSGLITKVCVGNYVEGKLKLEFVTDKKTGVKLCGLNARKNSLEKSFFHDLDLSSLEKEPGEKIFVFHSAIAEFKPSELWAMDALPMSLLPKVFSYYAAGHVHSRDLRLMPGFGWVGFPGPLFAADFRDLEDLLERPHGFFLVEISGDEVKPVFHPVSVCSVSKIFFDASGKTSNDASEELIRACQDFDAKGKIVLLHVVGSLSQGRTSEVQIAKARNVLLEKGASVVYVNRHKLSSPEKEMVKLAGLSRSDLEEKILKESIQLFKGKSLSGDSTLSKAKLLLDALKLENQGMTKSDYEKLVETRARAVLG